MNPDSLKALLIDQQLGELPAETSDLLDAYLAQEPEAAAEAVKMREILGITETTVNTREELFRVEGGRAREISFSMFHGFFRAAALATLVAVAGLLGFMTGRNEAPEVEPPSTLLASTENPPWARYRLTDDSRIALIASSQREKTTENE